MSEIKIEERIDQERGCGWRKEKALYLVSGGLAVPCGRMPLPLKRCPCCDQGVKPSRGWTWIDIDKLLAGVKCNSDPDYCSTCSLSKSLGRIGLLWVGEKFYDRPEKFSEEAARLGVSRRISQIPKDFKLGETWVAFAHRKGISRTCDCVKTGKDSEDCPDCGGERQVHTPALFHLFQPTAIEYVVKGDEKPDKLESLVKRGITLVKVKRATPEMELSL